MLRTVQKHLLLQQHKKSTILARIRLPRRLLVCLRKKRNQTNLATEAAKLTQTMTKTLQLRTISALRGFDMIFHSLLRVPDMTIDTMKNQSSNRA